MLKLLALLALLVLASPAAAVNVNVLLTDGTITFNGSTVELHATGPNLVVSGFDPFVIPLPACLGLCQPGEVVPAGMNVSFAFGGAVTYAGMNVSVIDSGLPPFATLSWTVTADPILMPPLGDPFTVTEPFLITLHVGLDNCPNCIPGVTGIDATGSGIATFSFAQSGRAWDQTSAVWTIQTPEPGTWLLLATGCIGLTWLRWRRGTTPVPFRRLSNH